MIRKDSEWRFVHLSRFNRDIGGGPEDYTINSAGIVCHVPTERFYAPKQTEQHFIEIDNQRFFTAFLLLKAFGIEPPVSESRAIITDPQHPVGIGNVMWRANRANSRIIVEELPR